MEKKEASKARKLRVKCGKPFEDYFQLRDHVKAEHVEYYETIKRFVEDTSHEGKVNE